MRVALQIIFFLVFNSGFLFSQSENSIESSDKKYIYHFFLAEKYKMLDENKKAITEYENCIKENPNEPNAFYQLSRIHLNLNNIEEAKEYILEARKLDPLNIWYAYLLMDVYYQNFEFEKQAGVLEDLIKIDKKNKIYYLEAVYTYINLGLYNKALKIIQKAAKNIADTDDLIILRSEVFQKQNQLEKAIQIILSAHKRVPGKLIFLEKLSELYVLKSEYQLANEIYQEILKIDPENATALLASYKIAQTQNNIQLEKDLFFNIIKSSQISKDQKIDLLFQVFSNNNILENYKNLIPEILNHCIFMYPEEFMFYVVLGDFQLLNSQKEEALNNYIQAINYGLKDKGLYEKVLNINLIENQLDDVLLYAKQALEYFPYHSIFYYYEGLAFMYKGDNKSAIKTLKKGVNYVMDDPLLKSEMYSILGDVYHKLGEHKDSDQSYDLALEINPEYIIVLNNYSYYLALRGGLDNLLKAESMILKCLELTKETPEPSFLDTYAWVLYQQGKETKDSNTKLEKFTLSKNMMDACFQNGGNSAVMYEHYGDILFQLNDISGAKTQWKEAFKKDPNNKNLKDKINKF